uniref:Uncharacterized protein n=1 Tax=Anguilla anguilla TaxID=7936 RepID=A0A0E9QG47_ANGAN
MTSNNLQQAQASSAKSLPQMRMNQIFK